jgi:antirestriction protein ArdC
LNRKEIVNGGYFGDCDYSLEELVAELTASFVCAEVGISNESIERNSEAYLASWYKSLQNDRKMFVTASARASKAADLILNRQLTEQED